MKEKILALCDLEETYAFRMAEYIVEKMPKPYTFHLFTKTDELRIFLDHHEISVLLIGESAIRQMKSKPEVPDIFVLSENKERPDASYHYIDKFQNPEQIISVMTQQISESADWTEKEIKTESKIKMIGIYSPVRRCLQTSFAMTLGQLLAREHKTLYMNFECYSGFSRMIHREFHEDMMDVLYYFKCAREKLTLRLSSIVQNINGLDFIPPGQSGIDMQSISGEKWLELLETIGRISDYEYVILDLTDGMNGLFELLSQCFKIYTITKDDGFAMAKMKQYEEILQLNEMNDIADKTVKCRFPFFKRLPADLSLMTHGELASYVKAIIQEDLYEKQAG